jgi:hypothetical protein
MLEKMLLKTITLDDSKKPGLKIIGITQLFSNKTIELSCDKGLSTSECAMDREVKNARRKTMGSALIFLVISQLKRFKQREKEEKKISGSIFLCMKSTSKYYS